MPEPAAEPRGGGGGIGATLKSKFGPMPVWGWLVAITVILLAWWLYEQHKNAGQTTAPMSGQPGVVVINQDEPDTDTPPGEPKEDKDKDDKKKKHKHKDEKEDKESKEQEQDERERHHRHGGHRRHHHTRSAPISPSGISPEPLVPITGPQNKAPRRHRKPNIGSFFPTVTPAAGEGNLGKL